VNISNFRADADLVGRRVRVSWDFLPEGAETLAAIPRVLLRRKTRDFEFPPLPQNLPAPFVIYDSSAFPPQGTTALDLPGWEAREGTWRIVTTVESAAQVVANRVTEISRRTTSTTLNASAVPIRRKVEVLDAGDPGAGLTPGATYYYELAVPATSQVFHTTTTATEVHGMGRTLYQMLPEIYRRHDVGAGPEVPGTAAVPEASTKFGQLRRFLDLFGVGFDSMRSSAEGLRNLHDIDYVDYRFLPLLADWIGWDLSFDAPIPIRRHEVKHAAALYRITGTIPGCMIWARRLTGWPARVKEFYRNVFFTNDIGDKDDPAHKGSRTVDTSNAALVSALGGFDDTAQYTYDTGVTENDWYAYNVVGVFVKPATGESVETVQRKLAKLRGSFEMFLPVNIRGVITVEMDPQTDVRTGTMNLLKKVGDPVT
jgi:phage tail-like protein